jgi:hypothetical protein
MNSAAPLSTQPKPKLLCWFSCGATSAIMVKLALDHYQERFNVIPITCNTRSSEHPDNERFFTDCQRWFGREIVQLRNESFSDVDDVAAKTRYMSGPKGARCTTELKKIPRLRFAQPDDHHAFGFSAGEQRRIKDFTARNPELFLVWPLVDHKLTKERCLRLLEAANIALPTMYSLGFDNNNCPGCYKAKSAWYWDRTRSCFPEIFALRSRRSRELGVRLVVLKGQRIFLDELPPGPFKKRKREEKLSCGPECGTVTV